jgi:hypothetical protein
MASKKTPSIQERALALLNDSDFFGKVREAVARGGLVGEERNIVAIFVVAISSLLKKPMNAILKRQFRWEEFPRFTSSALNTRERNKGNHELFEDGVELFEGRFSKSHRLSPRTK